MTRSAFYNRNHSFTLKRRKHPAMYYTYILESETSSDSRYIGIGHTSNLKKRIAEHNAGKCHHTSKNRPWKLALYIAFQTLPQAQHFERYLKSGSGHAFANRHFWNSN